MRKIYAELPKSSINSVTEQCDMPIYFGDVEYWGIKTSKLKDVPLTDDEIKNYADTDMPADMVPKTKQVVDDSQPVRYDEITATFMDNKSLKNINGQLMASTVQNQAIIGQLMADNVRNKTTIAGLMAEITKLKMTNGGTK